MREGRRFSAAISTNGKGSTTTSPTSQITEGLVVRRRIPFRHDTGQGREITVRSPGLSDRNALTTTGLKPFPDFAHRPHGLSIDGDAWAQTPHLDELARSGVRFDHAYCNAPLCMPSRASLWTSLYVHNHKAYNNRIPWSSDKKTIAHYFGAAGYRTSCIGKMHFVDDQIHGFDHHTDFNEWFQYLGPKVKIYADELSAPDDGSGMPQRRTN